MSEDQAPTAPKLWEDLLDFEVSSIRACDDPPAYVFRIDLKTRHGEWREVLPSPEAVRHFLRGLLAWDAMRPKAPPAEHLRAEVADPLEHPELQHRLRLSGLRDACELVLSNPARYARLEGAC